MSHGLKYSISPLSSNVSLLSQELLRSVSISGSLKKQTSWDWFLMTFTCLSLACGQIMGSSVLAAVLRRQPGSWWYCHWQMEQLLTRGLSHNTLARRPKHSKPISASQYDIRFFPLRYQFRKKYFFFTCVYSVFIYSGSILLSSKGFKPFCSETSEGH